MLIVAIDIRVKAAFAEAFAEASLENARHSVNEPGIARFDILRDESDPAHFMFIEVYRALDAQARHRETAHYLKWRDLVADMMAQPRTPVRYGNMFPGDEGW
jgi:quinol monooxygenase YgiN